MGKSFPARPARTWLLRLSLAAILAAFAWLVMRTAWAGARAAVDTADFPEDLAVKLQALPIIFPLHMATGAAALILGPLALALGHWDGARGWHRWIGRVAALDVLVAGLTAFPVALIQPVTLISAWGFVAQASIWLALLARAVWHIRHGRIKPHRRAMILMLAVMSGAIFFRLYLAFWAIMAHGKHFAAFYACDAWVAWGLPLSIGIAITRRGEIGHLRCRNGAGSMP
jgi:uncharacterized membrane protein